MADDETHPAILSLLTGYGMMAVITMVIMFLESLSIWEKNKRDGGFIILSLLASIIIGAIWPVSIPATWIIRSCVDSNWSCCAFWSCCGFSYPAWKAKKMARKQERAQEIEMDRMERAHQPEDDETRRRNEQDEEDRKLEEAKERVRRKMESMLGRGAEELEGGPSSSRDSASHHEAVEGMPVAATSWARGGSGINERAGVTPPRVLVGPGSLPYGSARPYSSDESSTPPPYSAATNPTGRE